jgi:DNA-binding transcriptional ArsR family regulator
VTRSRKAISEVVPSASQLKALAHPVRLQMLELLRLDGPATSTSLAQRLGTNTGTVSYHLRQLARHGFIEDEPERGNGRERWWRAGHDFTHVPFAEPSEPTARRARSAHLHASVTRMAIQLQEALAERGNLPRRWKRVTEDSDWTLWLTPEQAEKLMVELTAILRRALSETGAAQHAEPGAEQYTVQLHGFPRPGRIARRP